MKLEGEGIQLLDELVVINLSGLTSDNLGHLGTESVNLGGLGVAGLGDLVLLLSGEGNCENSEFVTISGGDINGGLDEGLPLLDEGAELIAGEVHAVEEGEAVGALDILNAELDVAVALGVVVHEIAEVVLDNASLELLRSNLKTSSTGDESLAEAAVLELRRGLEIVPLLLCHGVNNTLTITLLGNLRRLT